MAKGAAHGGNLRKVKKTYKGVTYDYWEGRMTTGYSPASGKQIQKSFYGKTQKEVLSKMQAAAVAIQNEGTFFEPAKLTLGKWLDTWIKDYSADKKPLTVKKYKTDIENHIKPALGGIKLKDLKPAHLQSFYNNLLEQELAPKSVKCIHGALCKALNVAVEQELISRNPAEHVTLPKVRRQEIKVLTSEQINLFMQASSGDLCERILKVILFTGMREGEALGLTWDCVDFKNSTLTINKQLQWHNQSEGGGRLETTKNDKIRVLTVPSFVMDLIKQADIQQKKDKMLLAEYWQGWKSAGERKSYFVFTKQSGLPLDAPQVYRHYKRIAEKIGAPDTTVHSLRHSYAVLSLQNGDDVKTVQTNLGHATAAFTLDVYGHASEDMKQKSAERMQAYIEEIS